jgi:signal transduction histidine kinase
VSSTPHLALLARVRRALETRTLTQTFHAAFIVLLLAQMAFAAGFFLSGLDQMSKARRADLNAKADVLLSHLQDSERAVRVRDRASLPEARTLNVSQLGAGVKLDYPNRQAPWDDLRGCRRRFTLAVDMRPLDVCAAIVPAADSAGQGGAPLGRFLYLTVLFPAPGPATFKSADDRGDEVRIEIRDRGAPVDRMVILNHAAADGAVTASLYPASATWATDRPFDSRGHGSSRQNTRCSFLQPELGGPHVLYLCRVAYSHLKALQGRNGDQRLQPPGSPRYDRPWPPANLADLSVRVEVLASRQGERPRRVGATFASDGADVAGVSVAGFASLFRGLVAPDERLQLADASGRIFWPRAGERPATGLQKIAPDQQRDLQVILTYEQPLLLVPMMAATFNVAGFLILLLLLTLFIYWVVFWRVLEPIRKLAASAQSAVRDPSRLAYLDPPQSHGEIAELAQAFNDLLREIDRQKAEEAAEQGRHAAEREIVLETKAGLIHAVGHEIRSPTQALYGAIPVGHPGRHNLDRLSRAVDHFLSASGPLEALATIPMQIEDVDIREFLSEVEAADGMEDLAFQLPAGAVFVRADRDALETSIEHILDNARRYTPDGQKIAVSLKVNAQAVTLDIDNEGPQIDPDMIARVFEYGVSTQPTGGRNFGQGLAVARINAVRMGATLQAINLADGVRFRMTFAPLAPAVGHDGGSE